ncbi:MAG: Crp/Fnr family transcriptional regulator [Ruminococcaceae bacterium]|nr:Crp/Fnr family transcriptional regulator [Oscillospiraceae bacterium]
MKKPAIFYSITQEEIDAMMHCFKAKRKKFTCGDTMVMYASEFDQIGILLYGEAELVRYEEDGARTILERYDPDHIFGKLNIMPEDGASIVCSKDCEVITFSYYHLIDRCPNVCPHHGTLVENVLRMMIQRTQNLSSRIDILSHRTLRGKLLAYFETTARAQNRKSFTLPFSINDLADFLCVNRSAMMREMKKMKEEGIFSSKGRQITLH